MGFAAQYLARHKGITPLIPDVPAENLKFVVVVPAFREPDITGSLNSLWDCERPKGSVEIIIVINSSETADRESILENEECLESTVNWITKHQDPLFRFYVIHQPNMPSKDAGVGLARKIGMDEAVTRFNAINNPLGYILSFDADSLCDRNYFTAIEKEIDKNAHIKGFDIYFEHPVTGNEFHDQVYKGITEYELYLRYVNLSLRNAGFPFAHHTVGSCFGVRADIYVAQGGMNKRKAGEDFYFLHKIIPLGNFMDITSTRVVPSPRMSMRVPFGTGPAISRLINSGDALYTYAPECFQSLTKFFKLVDELFNADEEKTLRLLHSLPEPLLTFLMANKAMEAIHEIKRNTRSPETFVSRFFKWFDAFSIVKFLNYASSTFYKKIPVVEAVKDYLQTRNPGVDYAAATPGDLLGVLRMQER